MKTAIPVIIVLVLCGVLVAWLFWPREAPEVNPIAGDEGARLIIISPHNEDIRREYEQAFAAWHEARFGKPVSIDWQDPGGTSDAVRYIRSRLKKSPQGIGIDLFWGGGVEPYIQLAKEGALVPVRLAPEIIDALPRTLAGVPVYDSERRWFGTAISGFGVIYNRKRLRELRLPEPASWSDLARPELVDEVISADPRHSGSAFMAYEIILQAYGWEEGWQLLTSFAGNVKTHTRTAGEVPKMVSLGEAAMGPAIDFYAWAQIARDGREKIGYVLPAGLTVINPDAIGVLKGAPGHDLAVRFVEFVLSAEGQRLWLLPAGSEGGPAKANLARIPVRTGLLAEYRDTALVTMDPAKFKAGFEYDASKAAARRTVLKELIGALLVDSGPELRPAWKAVVRAGRPQAALKEFYRMPVGEDELTELGRKRWADAVFRNERKTAWAVFARDKYAKAMKLAAKADDEGVPQ